MPRGAAPLEPGEHVVVRTGLHPVALLGAVTWAAFVLLVTTLLVVNNALPPATQMQIVLGGLLVTACGFVRPILRLRRSVFTLTDRRLLVEAGAFGIERLAIPLAGATVSAERPRRLADAAVLVVSVGEGVRSWNNVAGAAALAAAARRSTGGRRERRPGS